MKGGISMKRLSKNEICVVVYAMCFFYAYLEIRNNLISPWIVMTGKSFTLYNSLCICTFLSMYGVTSCVILRGDTIRRWREYMKKNIIGWIIILFCSVSFVILMIEIYKHMGNRNEAVRVIIASTLIFLPNVFALIQINTTKS